MDVELRRRSGDNEANVGGDGRNDGEKTRGGRSCPGGRGRVVEDTHGRYSATLTFRGRFQGGKAKYRQNVAMADESRECRWEEGRSSGTGGRREGGPGARARSKIFPMLRARRGWMKLLWTLR